MAKKIRFREQVEKDGRGKERRFKRDRVEVANGSYVRVFERKDEPFGVEDEHWPMLRRTGEFELVEEAAPGGETGQQKADGEATTKPNTKADGNK